MKLEVVIASTRPGRVGLAVGTWFTAAAKQHGGFEVSVTDLAELDLPLLDEPHHPRLQQYTKDHTKEWSKRVDAADAFVFVMPEYNYFAPPSLINAIDYLSHEWKYKPVGFVGYGGISGGMRAIQSLKPLVSSMKLVPIPEAVTVTGVAKLVSDDHFAAEERYEVAAATMLDEVARWAAALQPLRTPSKE